jgi:CspA family cold shock protein
LLLARSNSWLDSLPKHGECPQEVAAWLSIPEVVQAVELPPWSKDDTVRLTSYRLALDDYALATRLATPPNAYVPRLCDSVFDRPLYLHLAALAALEGQRPDSADALLRDQLRREWHYWRGIHGESVDYDDWSDALAYVILCQDVSVEQLRNALETLKVDARTLVAALHQSYPAGDRIAPLEPDLMAEALLRERLAGPRGSALLHTVFGAGIEQVLSALPVIARLTSKTSAIEPDQTAGWTKILIDGLTPYWSRYSSGLFAAAQRAEPVLQEVLFTSLLQLEQLLNLNLMVVGVIKTIRTDKGFGFIATAGNEKDIFFHGKTLVGVQFDELQEGDAVTFSIEHTPKGRSAKVVKRV